MRSHSLSERKQLVACEFASHIHPLEEKKTRLDLDRNGTQKVGPRTRMWSEPLRAPFVEISQRSGHFSVLVTLYSEMKNGNNLVEPESEAHMKLWYGTKDSTLISLCVAVAGSACVIVQNSEDENENAVFRRLRCCPLNAAVGFLNIKTNT